MNWPILDVMQYEADPWTGLSKLTAPVLIRKIQVIAQLLRALPLALPPIPSLRTHYSRLSSAARTSPRALLPSYYVRMLVSANPSLPPSCRSIQQPSSPVNAASSQLHSPPKLPGPGVLSGIFLSSPLPSPPLHTLTVLNHMHFGIVHASR
ncbi:unnamed protein product [Rodentolepis nana]|uniref:Uncharacterized protein n=1 Tax=Rodentolepis nana TaxID=102285 RepID=A0A0R3TNH3_RODNA|nr:unnamed protein product [Rodentolepis nana]